MEAIRGRVAYILPLDPSLVNPHPTYTMNDDVQTGGTRPNFSKMEEAMAAYWDKMKIFDRSIEERPESKTFVFYDGPPFATGTPHHGHFLQSVIKDAIPRYKTMQGYRVPRRWGWDCHGLPVENLVEKELQLKAKQDIEAYGVDRFTDACRQSVFRYVNEWGRYIRRLGRWVDMDHAYRTIDDSYIESVWWVFAELVKKGHVYKDRRVSLYCPRCSTPLSNFEIGMGNSYVDYEDPSVMIKFRTKDKQNSYLLVWTTTPWTLPANVALAVHPELVYVTVRVHATGDFFTFAEARMNDVLSQYFPLSGDDSDPSTMPFEIVERHTGAELEGIAYEPLYTFVPVEGAYRVVTGTHVSAADGTGIVHTAPAYGEEDMQVAKEHNLPVLESIDDAGCMLPNMGAWGGMYVKDANALIEEDLEARGYVYRRERITHSVPVCWRCNTTLLYRAQPAWFVNVTKLKTKLLETAKRTHWHPEHFRSGRFGKGLETAPDWNISRTRYWGAPLPVWKCDVCPEQVIVDSVAMLRERAHKGSFPTHLDLHRPAIDAVLLDCACGGVMRRIPEVFDCWFESGSMPYASIHYPFENKGRFESHFPADFIGEAQDQTRGWFYVLHVLSTALFNKPAFKDVIVTGLIMAEDGKKMSKSLKNYPDPWDIMMQYGADTLRVYLLSSPIVEAEQLNFSVRELDEVHRRLFGILWNVVTFYQTYAGNDTVELSKPRSAHVLDRWLQARLHGLMQEIGEAYERYDLIRAVRPLRGFVDDLSTWWLRRSRDRMRGSNGFERMDALKTLREVLREFAALMAPAAPFMADRIYLDMGGSKASVHLERWPKADERLIDERLLSDMAWVRRVATAGLEQRAAVKMPVRQALASATVYLKDAGEARRLSDRTELIDLIREELNVETVLVQGGHEGEDDLHVALDTELTPALKEKGMVRELVRHLMSLRKSAGLQPQDRIRVMVAIEDAGLRAVIARLSDALAVDVKADEVTVTAALPRGTDGSEITLDGKCVGVALTRV
jgi:isoleucyl-tRNA synthetase